MHSVDPEQLVRQAEHVRALARRLLFDADAADDVVQEACLAALQRPPRAGVPLRAWLVRVVRNLAARRYREAARQQRALAAAGTVRRERVAGDLMHRVDLHQKLMRAVQALHEPYRTTLLLRYFDGLPPRAIAVRMGVPAATVSTRIHRGLALLRARLDGEYGGRAAWLVAFAPLGLSGGREGMTLATIVTGGTIVGLKSWVGLALASLLLFALVVLPAFQADDGTRSENTSPETTRDVAAGLKGRTSGQLTVEGAHDSLSGRLAQIDRALDLHGQVTDVSGRPVAGAVVETYTLPWQRANLFHLDEGKVEVPGPGTATASDGTFVIRLPRGREVHLRVRAKGFLPKRIHDCLAGERLQVILDEGATVSVRTVDETGKPVAKVAVRVWYLKSSGLTPLEWKAVTDTGGRATFDGLLPGLRHSVEAIHPDLAPPRWQEMYPVAGRTKELEIVMPAGRLLRGRVVDAETGDAIVGARVGLGWTFLKAVKTNAEGRFELAGYAEESGYTELAANAPGFAPTRTRPPFADMIEIRLTKGAPVVGRVVDIAGKPVAGAYVAAAEENYNAAEFGRSAVDGTFRLGAIRPGTPHLVVAYAPGYGRVVFDFISTSDEEHSLGDLVLPPARAIEGVVLAPDGLPAPGLAVELRGWNANRDLLEPGIGVVSDRYGSREVRQTDDLGRFRFPDLSPGTYALQARPVQRKWVGVSVTLAEAEEVKQTELKLVGGHRLRVRVEDEAGAPVPGVNVTIHCEDMWQFGQYTGATGVVEIDSDSRPTAVDLATPFQIEAWVIPPLRKVTPGEEEVVLVMGRAGRVSGRVVDPDGNPLSMAFLEVMVDGEAFVQLSSFMRNQLSTSAEGRFKATVPLAGDIELVAMEIVRPDGAIWAGRATGVRAGQTDVTLRLAPVVSDRSLTVLVKRPDGRPAKDVQVYAKVRGKLVPGANVRTDEKGRATLARLPAARISVFARPTPETADAAGWLSWSKYPVEPNGQELAIQFVAARVLRGRVVDSKGEPVQGASVGAWHGQRMQPVVTTDEDGRFELRLHPSEEGQLRIIASDATRQATNNNVSRETEEITLTLPD